MNARSDVIQGWNADPFERFEQRYFSQGAPTALVRSRGVEGRDQPGLRPETPQERRAAPIVAEPEPLVGPRLYVRRERRFRARATLVIALATPVLGWEVLVSSRVDRIVGGAAFAIVTLTVAIVVLLLREPRPASRHSASGEFRVTSGEPPRVPAGRRGTPAEPDVVREG